MSQGIEFLCDSCNGKFIPQIMINRLIVSGWSIDCEYIEDLQDPDNEWYWDIWDQVVDNAQFTDENGNKWYLWQDGDLFAYCEALMTEEEKENFFEAY